MAKIIIVGAGHNGLVTACYLAKAGHKVAIFERREVVGGCAATDDTTFPGFKISSASYVNSLFLPQIVEDLNLRAYGYEVIKRDPYSFTPLLNGKYLLLGSDREANMEEIGKFSKCDARNYARYEDALDEVAGFAGSLLTMTPPNIPPRTPRDAMRAGKIIKDFFALGPSASVRLLKLLTQDARKFLDSWFESEPLKATLLTDSAIGAMGFSGYVLLHHVMGEAGGARGVWGYQRGGMGAISNALASAARDLGVKIHTGEEVEEVLLDSFGTSYGVLLGCRNGVEFADHIVSNMDPKRTTMLLPWIARERFARRFIRKIDTLDFESPVMKINLTLSGLPNFRAIPGTDPAPHHRGTIHISPSSDYVMRAMQDAQAGEPSFQPILELTIPSVVDETLAPSGKHTMGIFVQYAPYHLSGGRSWDDIKERYFRTNILGVLDKYISNMHEIIEGVQILSPLDLEREFGITEGNIFHGAMGLDQLFSFRPVRGYAQYRTPIKGLYLCGAGTHPGGGVMGACGYNAAREIIRDLC